MDRIEGSMVHIYQHSELPKNTSALGSSSRVNPLTTASSRAKLDSENVQEPRSGSQNLSPHESSSPEAAAGLESEQKGPNAEEGAHHHESVNNNQQSQAAALDSDESSKSSGSGAPTQRSSFKVSGIRSNSGNNLSDRVSSSLPHQEDGANDHDKATKLHSFPAMFPKLPSRKTLSDARRHDKNGHEREGPALRPETMIVLHKYEPKRLRFRYPNASSTMQRIGTDQERIGKRYITTTTTNNHADAVLPHHRLGPVGSNNSTSTAPIDHEIARLDALSLNENHVVNGSHGRKIPVHSPLMPSTIHSPNTPPLGTSIATSAIGSHHSGAKNSGEHNEIPENSSLQHEDHPGTHDDDAHHRVPKLSTVWVDRFKRQRSMAQNFSLRYISRGFGDAHRPQRELFTMKLVELDPSTHR